MTAVGRERREHLVGVVEICPARRQRDPVRGGDADRGCAAHGEYLMASASSAASGAAELDELVGQPALVEDDNGVVLEPDDPLRDRESRLVASARYVPSSHEARYFACSSVSWSIAMPIVASLSRAISSSICFGTT